jgi:hypothetical protein
MSLFDYRTVVSHPEVMEALHDVQFTASICYTELSVQCLPELFGICNVHVHIKQLVAKSTQNESHKGSIGFLELVLILVRYSSFR